MSQAQRNHKVWLAGGRNYLKQQLRRITTKQQNYLSLSRQLVLLLTLERSLLNWLLQTLRALPPGTMQECRLNLSSQTSTNSACLVPPSDEAVQETLTELAQFMGTMESFTGIVFEETSATVMNLFLAVCSRLEKLHFESCNVLTTDQLEGIVRTTFSMTTLRQLLIRNANFASSDAIDAFCYGLDAVSLEHLELDAVSFKPEHGEQVGRALARCSSLVHFQYEHVFNTPQLFTAYCMALSRNAETKLERLLLGRWGYSIDLQGDRGVSEGVDATAMQDIRRLLGVNVQRKTCGPLFAAIGDAQTDEARKRCMVKAFSEVACPILFEYISSNQYNLIVLIQQLGRSRKRKRAS